MKVEYNKTLKLADDICIKKRPKEPVVDVFCTKKHITDSNKKKIGKVFKAMAWCRNPEDIYGWTPVVFLKYEYSSICPGCFRQLNFDTFSQVSGVIKLAYPELLTKD